jgi:hypothetical protein
MRASAGSLFEGASFNGLTLLVSFLAVLVAITAVYYQRQSTPRKRLEIRAGNPAALTSHVHAETSLSVSHDGTVLESPYLVTLEVANTGRGDIAAGQFDLGAPIRVDFHVPVVEAFHTPDASATFRAEWATSGSVLHVGPSLLPRASTTRFQVLTDGRPQPTYEAPVIDAQVKIARLEESQPSSSQSWKEAAFSMAAGAGAVSFAVMLVMLFLAWRQQDPSIRTDGGPIASGGTATVTGAHFSGSSEVLLAFTCDDDLSFNRKVSADKSGNFVAKIKAPKLLSPPHASYENCVVTAAELG